MADFASSSQFLKHGQPDSETLEEAARRISQDVEEIRLHQDRVKVGLDRLRASRRVWANRVVVQHELMETHERMAHEARVNCNAWLAQVRETDKSIAKAEDVYSLLESEARRKFEELDAKRHALTPLLAMFRVPCSREPGGAGPRLQITFARSQFSLTVAGVMDVCRDNGGTFFSLNSPRDLADLRLAERAFRRTFSSDTYLAPLSSGEGYLVFSPDGKITQRFGSLDDLVGSRLIAYRDQIVA